MTPAGKTMKRQKNVQNLIESKGKVAEDRTGSLKTNGANSKEHSYNSVTYIRKRKADSLGGRTSYPEKSKKMEPVVSNGVEEFQSIRKETENKLQSSADFNSSVKYCYAKLMVHKTVCDDCQQLGVEGHCFPKTENTPGNQMRDSIRSLQLVHTQPNCPKVHQPMHLKNLESCSDSEGYSSGSGTECDGSNVDRLALGYTGVYQFVPISSSNEEVTPPNLIINYETGCVALDENICDYMETTACEAESCRSDCSDDCPGLDHDFSYSDELHGSLTEAKESGYSVQEEPMVLPTSVTPERDFMSVDNKGHAAWVAQILEPTRAPGYYTREFSQLVEDYGKFHGLKSEGDYDLDSNAIDNCNSMGSNSRMVTSLTGMNAESKRTLIANDGRTRLLSTLTYESDLDSSFASAAARYRKLSTASSVSDDGTENLEVRRLSGSFERLQLVPF